MTFEFDDLKGETALRRGFLNDPLSQICATSFIAR